MSKSKARPSTDACADCGATEPTWASINRGILLCVQCCNTHRSLGRHVSIVKSLKSVWPASLLAMVHALNAAGANSIWEHALEKDAKLSKRKPQPSDSLEDKAKFIRAKHQHNEFLQRPMRDDTLCMENELGKQLHASVRSNNVLMSLKLLLQGADPNYFHDEKGSTPLHAAVKANQLSQCELLIVYGSDPTYPDASGKTPIHYARQGINTNVLNRLVEAQYEVTDKFYQFLCMRKPEHQAGVHFLVPKVFAQSSPSAAEKLRKLPNNVFEELVQDVFDEVDRREIEASWLGSADTIDLPAVPFLPVNAAFSTTRNQSRQKLARFATPELKALVRDILADVQRRQQQRAASQLGDDDPLYDSVASDDDYAQVCSDDGEEAHAPAAAVAAAKQSPPRDVNQNVKPAGAARAPSEAERYAELMRKLRESTNTITDLQGEVVNLKALVEHLSNVNHELRSRLSHVDVGAANGNRAASPPPPLARDSGSQSLDPGLLHNRSEDTHSLTSLASDRLPPGDNNNDGDRNAKRIQRPSSMYETREGLRTPNWQTMKNQIKQNELSNRVQPLPNSKNPNVMQCIEPVTRGISELWKCIQGTGRDNCIHHADRICFAVTNLTKAIPAEAGGEVVKQLLDAVGQLQANCIGLQNARASDAGGAEKYMTQVRTSAYEIAKATKDLLTRCSAH